MLENKTVKILGEEIEINREVSIVQFLGTTSFFYQLRNKELTIVPILVGSNPIVNTKLDREEMTITDTAKELFNFLPRLLEESYIRVKRFKNSNKIVLEQGRDVKKDGYGCMRVVNSWEVVGLQ